MSIKDKLEKRFYWKDLSTDGLLKEPSPTGPHYDEVELNNYCGFKTEDEALEALDRYLKHGAGSREDVYQYVSFVLITTYETKK